MPFPRLCLLLTPSLCARDPWWTLRSALEGGVDLVQWRVKHAEPRRRDLESCQRACAEFGVPVVVNDDPALAAAAGAAGAHVGQDDMPPEVARQELGPDRWLGVSTHDRRQVTAAQEGPGAVDYLGFGPCFPTATRGYAEGQGPAALAAALAAAALPVLAIGGITVENLGSLREVGCARIAVCRTLLAADSPAAEARRLLAMLS